MKIQLRIILEKIVDTIPKDAVILVSGGLDSAAIACLLLSQRRELVGFTHRPINLNFCDESTYVRFIAKRYPNFKVHYCDFRSIDLLKELREFIGVNQQPIETGSFLLQYLIFKEIKKKGFQKIIYCQYADEIFGGYNHFLVARAKEDMYRLRWRQAYNNLAAYVGQLRGINDDHILKKTVTNFLKFSNLRQALRGSIPNAARLVNIARRGADALGLQLIVPYNSALLTQFAENVGNDHLVRDGKTKIVLREAVRDIVPAEIIHREIKYSFFAPDNYWLEHARRDIRKIKDEKVRMEYEKFWANRERRFYRGLWRALSEWALGRLGDRAIGR